MDNAVAGQKAQTTADSKHGRNVSRFEVCGADMRLRRGAAGSGLRSMRYAEDLGLATSTRSKVGRKGDETLSTVGRTGKLSGAIRMT